MKKAPDHLNETASPFTLLRVLIPLAIGAALLLLLALGETDSVLRTIYLIFIGVMLLLLGLLLRLSRRYRCIMDDVGVQLGRNHLPWAEIRSAAVIRRDNLPRLLSRFPDDSCFILLSLRTPENAVDQWHFLMEAPQGGTELRIPYTPARRAMIEQQLHMTLPTYHF